LTRLPGATYGGILTGDGWAIASASPELLVRVAAGVVETRPIKGTRPATVAGRRELLGSAKERAEHIAIVDSNVTTWPRSSTGSVDARTVHGPALVGPLAGRSRIVARVADGGPGRSAARGRRAGR
jgi:para-aminobenzoate synthetase component 1